MVQLTVQLTQKDPNLLGRSMTLRIKKIIEAEKSARKAAAAEATKVTQASFHYLRPPNAPRRPGREATGGRFAQALRWVAQSGDDAPVEFDLGQADHRVPYWIIQEIGTGESATLRRGGASNPRGRPTTGATYVRTVKAQRGRAIPFSLAFGTGPRGAYSPPGAASGQQLYLRAMLRNAPLGMSYQSRQMHITREIEGQHFVRKGGEQGFREYRTSVLAAARRTFAGRGYRP